MSYERLSFKQRSLRTLLVFVGGMLLLGCLPTQAPQAGQPPMQEAIEPMRSQGQSLPITARAQIGNQTIDLEVARTPQQQATGLMYRQSLADDRGMLFPFARSQTVSFWMKNVEVPLDMIFLQDGRVVEIANDVPPCNTNPCPTYGSPLPVNAVIELRGGRAVELGLQVGETIVVENLTAVRTTRP